MRRWFLYKKMVSLPLLQFTSSAAQHRKSPICVVEPNISMTPHNESKSRRFYFIHFLGGFCTRTGFACIRLHFSRLELGTSRSIKIHCFNWIFAASTNAEEISRTSFSLITLHLVARKKKNVPESAIISINSCNLNLWLFWTHSNVWMVDVAFFSLFSINITLVQWCSSLLSISISSKYVTKCFHQFVKHSACDKRLVLQFSLQLHRQWVDLNIWTTHWLDQ